MKNIAELPAILQALAEPFPENLLQHKPQRDKKNNTTTYLTSIAWHTACRKLDEVYPYWSQNVERIEVVGSMVVATCSISLHFTDGLITRTNTGIEAMSADSWGDPISNAVAMGFKRAAALFGVGRYLYYKDAADAPAPARPQTNAYNVTPIGQPQSNSYAASASTSYAPQAAPSDGVKMASEGQLKCLWAISKKKNMDLRQMCGGKEAKHLTMAAASTLIDQLNKEQGHL